MSEPLDARLREQVAELHQNDGPVQPPLGAEAQARVLGALNREAVQLSAARKRRHQLWMAGGSALLAAAAAVVLYVRVQPSRSSEPQASACALPLLAADAFDAEHGSSLTLAELGNLVTQPHSTLHVEQSGPCELSLRLDSGTLAGDLHKLRPARLVIRAAQGDVIVTGTRFSVQSADGLEVLLSSGVVDVELRDQAPVRLMPGNRLHKAAGEAATTAPLSAAEAQRLSSWLERPTPPAPAAQSGETASASKPAAHAPSSRELLDGAEAARRASHWTAAREAYRGASQGRDADAEIALLRWAGLELEQHAPNAALRLLNEHARRFSRGTLGAEAGWLEVRARMDLGQTERAERAARKLNADYAGTPQAKAAQRLLAHP